MPNRFAFNPVVPNLLRRVPSGLEALYVRIEESLVRNFREGDEKLARTILQWAACSKRPLSLAGLEDALKPEYSHLIDLRFTVSRVCGEFVIITPQVQILMTHARARDFLLQSPDRKLFIPQTQSHNQIFRKCINYIMTSNLKSPRHPSKPDLFLEYAISAWPYHLSNGCTFLRCRRNCGLLPRLRNP